MTFLTWPIAAIAAAVAIPTLIILYFLKLKRRDMEVSTTLLWKKAIQDLQANAPFQKLRRNILLFLQLLVLIAALLALAQPEFRDRGSTRQRHIILIDRSASMACLDGEETPKTEDALALAPNAGNGASGAGASAAATGIGAADLRPPAPGKLTRLDAAKKKALAIVNSLKDPGLIDLPGVGGGSGSGGESTGADSAGSSAGGAGVAGIEGEEAMVIAFDTSAEVRQTFTSNKAELRAAIESITQSESPTSIDRAYALAQAYTGKEKFEEDRGFVPIGPEAAIHLFTDGRLPDADKVKAGPRDIVYYHGVGSVLSTNIAIASVSPVRAFDNPRKLAIYVGLQSTLRVPTTVEAELSIDGNVVQTRDVEIGPATPPPINPEDEIEQVKPWTPGAGGFVFELDRAEAGVGTITIRLPGEPGGVGGAGSLANALSTDDTAYFVFPPARRLSVAVVTEGNLWLRFALESLNLSKIEMIKPGEFQKMLDGQGGGAGGTSEVVSLSQFDVYIFDKVLPLVKPPEVQALGARATTGAGAAEPTGTSGTPGTTGTAGTGGAVAPGTAGAAAPVPTPKKIRSLPPGRSLVLGAVPAPPLGALATGTYDVATIADVQKDHPALALAGLENVALGQGAKIEIATDTPVRSIANSDKGPVILEVNDAMTRALVLTFDPFATNWPLDSGWVLFLADALGYLGEVNTGTSPGLLQTGSVLQSRLPSEARADGTLASGARDVRLVLPDNSSVNLEPGVDGSIAFGPIDQTGLYTLSWKGVATAQDTENPPGSRNVRRALAANLTDVNESDVSAAPKMALAREVVTSRDDQLTDVTRKLWPWLVLAALAVVLFEWFVYNKKVML